MSYPEPSTLSEFLAFLEREYNPRTISSYRKTVAEYTNWASNSQKHESIESSLKMYMKGVLSARDRDDKLVRAALRLYYRFLTGKRLTAKEKEPSSESVEAAVAGYLRFMDRVGRRSDATMKSHAQYLRRFLLYAFPGNCAVECSKITVALVRDFLTLELKHLEPVSLKGVIGVLRGYFRFLDFNGLQVEPGLSVLPLSAPVWPNANVPVTFGESELRSIGESYTLKTHAGIRDYAIYLCFVELGLRVSEVAALTLDDFKWRDARILIREGKSRTQRELPITVLLGEAIVRYLEVARPATKERTLFVRFSHVAGEPMGREQIRGCVRRAYARAGITASITGTHILRHSKAKAMYEAGTSFKVIADVLGHESIDTTVIYTKVGLSALQSLARCWPEVNCDET